MIEMIHLHYSLSDVIKQLLLLSEHVQFISISQINISVIEILTFLYIRYGTMLDLHM